MAKLQTTVTLNLHGLRKFREALSGDLRTTAARPIRDALHEWAAILGRFLTNRWELYSRGGGNWKPLKPATLEAKKRKALLPFILRATDEMFQSFAPDLARKPGKVTEDIPFGVRVGFGGGMNHIHGDSNITIAKLAMIHQQKRKIIVPPDTKTRAEMRAVMEKALMEVAHESV